MNKNKPLRIGCEIIAFPSAIIFETFDSLHIGTYKDNQFIDEANGDIYEHADVLGWGYVSELLKYGDKKWTFCLTRSRLK